MGLQIVYDLVHTSEVLNAHKMETESKQFYHISAAANCAGR